MATGDPSSTPPVTPPTETPPPATSLSLEDEKLWAMLAHAGAIAGYAGSLALQWVAPLVIYIMYKDKSKFVAFHALQSLVFQLGLLAVALIVNVIVALVTCGMGLIVTIPLTLVIGIGYPIVVAIKSYNGEWYEYWLAGPWARKQVGA